MGYKVAIVFIRSSNIKISSGPWSIIPFTVFLAFLSHAKSPAATRLNSSEKSVLSDIFAKIPVCILVANRKSKVIDMVDKRNFYLILNFYNELVTSRHFVIYL